MTDELIQDARERMKGAVDSLDHDLAGYRTGRASTALVDRLVVDYYGVPTPLPLCDRCRGMPCSAAYCLRGAHLEFLFF